MEVNNISNLRKTAIKENIPFNVIIPIVEVNNLDPLQQDSTTSTNSQNNPVTIIGLARNTEMSLSHHLTTENCIKSMKSQIIEAAKVNKPLPSCLDHDSKMVIGNIVGVKNSDDTELWPITELLPLSGNPAVDAPVQKVTHWLTNNVKTGMSIQGYMTSAQFVEDMDTDEWWIEIDDLQLLENTVTVLPAQTETAGTVAIANNLTCKNGFCQQLGNQIMEHITNNHQLFEKIEEAKKSDYIVNQACYDNAVQQIKDGNIDSGSWSAPNASDFDSIDDYIKIALAKHPDGDPKLAGTYGFEIGKTNGKISRQGVIAAKTAAAGARSSAGKNAAIYDAANKLLQLIDDKSDGNQQMINLDKPRINGGDIMVNTIKCPKCGAECVESAKFCMECAADLQVKERSIDPERFINLEQGVNFLIQDLNERKQAEAAAQAKKEEDLRFQQALDAQKTEHDEEINNLKQEFQEKEEAWKSATTEFIEQKFGELINNRQGVRQLSRDPENNNTQEGNPQGNNQVNGQLRDVSYINHKNIDQMVFDPNKSVMEQLNQIPIEERYKSLTAYPPIIFGKPVNKAFTTTEFMKDHVLGITVAGVPLSEC
jgi:hypothetical protein